MSWRSQLEQLCDAANVRDVTVDTSQPGNTIPWVDVKDEEQLREVLALATASSRRILPAGSGEHLPTTLLQSADAVVSLQRFDHIVDYEPDDLTMVAQSGVTLRQLDATVAQKNQLLAIDCSRSRAATLGGAVAGNRSGLGQLRHGTWRDHVLGARVMHADGSISRTGSRVVKSVSGYDLVKLYVGSQGSAAFLLDLNLRLLCAFESTGTLRASLPSASAAEALRGLHADRGLQPSSILLVAQPQVSRAPGMLDVVVRFEGRASVVAQQLERCQQHIGGSALADDAAKLLDDQLRLLCDTRAGANGLCLTMLPVDVLPKALEWLPRLDAPSGFVAQYGVGTMHLFFSESVARPLAEAKPASAALLELQRAVQKSFDPRGVLAGGDPVARSVS